MSQFATVRNDDTSIFQQYFNFSCVQAGVSAFVQATIATGLTPDLGVIAVIDSVVFETSGGLTISAAGTAPDLDLTVTRVSKAAIPLMSDADVLAKYRLKAQALTTTGLAVITQEEPTAAVIMGKQIIVGPNVYVQLDTTGFSAVMTATGRINYHTEKMTKQAILEILYG